MESLGPIFLLAVPVSGVLAWALTRWWYRREIAAGAHRLEKCERKLQSAAQQVGQARKQIEKLQRELSEARRAAAVASSQLGSQRPRAVAAAPDPAPAAAPQPQPAANNGFADTMPM